MDFDLYFKTIKEPIFEKSIWIIPNVISNSMIVFTLFGDLVEQMVVESIAYRAIDQKKFADFTTETLFSTLFKNEVEVKYNVYESISVKTIISNLELLAKEVKSVQDLITQLKKEPEKVHSSRN